jgi:hypothetical protein
MEQECSLPYSNSRSPLPILSQVSPFRAPLSLKIHVNIIRQYSLALPSVLFPSVFFTKVQCAATFPVSAIFPAHLNLLYLITRIIFGEHYRSLSRTHRGLFFQWRVVTAFPNPQAGGPSPVGFSWLLFKTFPAALHICRPFLHPQPVVAPCQFWQRRT